jgi:hypothetical protein
LKNSNNPVFNRERTQKSAKYQIGKRRMIRLIKNICWEFGDLSRFVRLSLRSVRGWFVFEFFKASKWLQKFFLWLLRLLETVEIRPMLRALRVLRG